MVDAIATIGGVAGVNSITSIGGVAGVAALICTGVVDEITGVAAAVIRRRDRSGRCCCSYCWGRRGQFNY